jgi:hypothetical protein
MVSPEFRYALEGWGRILRRFLRASCFAPLDVFFKGPQNPLPPKWAGKRDLAGLYLGFCGQGEKSEISELRPLSRPLS